MNTSTFDLLNCIIKHSFELVENYATSTYLNPAKSTLRWYDSHNLSKISNEWGKKNETMCFNLSKMQSNGTNQRKFHNQSQPKRTTTTRLNPPKSVVNWRVFAQSAKKTMSEDRRMKHETMCYNLSTIKQNQNGTDKIFTKKSVQTRDYNVFTAKKRSKMQ